MRKLMVLLLLASAFYGQVSVFTETLEIGNQPLAQALKTIITRANYEYSVEADISNMKVISVKIAKGTAFEKSLGDFLWKYELTYTKDKASRFKIRKMTDAEILVERERHSDFRFKEKYKGLNFDEKILYNPGTKFTGELRQILKTMFVNDGIPYGWFSAEERKTYEGVKLDYTTSGKESMKVVLENILKSSNLKYKIDAGGKICISNKDRELKFITKVYFLTYEDAENMARQLKGILTKDGIYKVDTDTNSLIITDNPEVFDGVESILKEID